MKSKIIRYFIVIFSIVAILLALVKVFDSNKKLNTYLAIGDYLSVSGNLRGERITSFSDMLGEYFVSNEIVGNVNTNYTASSIDSFALLEMISKDSYSGKDSGLASLIKDSKYITISVGMNDIIEYIRFDSNNQKMIYDKEFIKRKLEIMKQNYYEIIEEIKEINSEASVLLVGYYCPFNWVDSDNLESVNEVFDLLNNSVKQVSELMNVSYVDISSVGVEENMYSRGQIYLNQEGQEVVFYVLKEYIDK